MKSRTADEENKDAREKREEKKASLTGKSRAQEGTTFVSLEEKLALDSSNLTRDDKLDYAGFRGSKRAGFEIKLEVSVSQQQQQQEQQQQQQQQQQQVTQTQQIRAPALKNFPPYPGYKDLFSIQKFDHGKKSDVKLFTTIFGSKALDKLSKLAGNHDSQFASIGYLTMAAVKEMSQEDFLLQFSSGVYLEPGEPEKYLPDGFCLFMTEGERHLPLAAAAATKDALKDKQYDRREFPRLVLDYKPETKNQKKHPFRMRLTPRPKACEVIGTPAQFNLSGTKYVFYQFERDRYVVPNFHEIEKSRTALLNTLRIQNLAAANMVIKKVGGMINYASQKNTNSLYSLTLDNIEKSISEISHDIKKSNDSQRKQLFNFMRAEDETLAKQLIAKYRDLLNLCGRQDICGLWDIFFSAGCVGLKIFLEKIHSLYESDKGHTFFYFKHSFLLTSPNWMEFLENNALETFDKIMNLTSIQRIWWNALSAYHIQNCGWSDLVDLFSSFEYFWSEYRKIGAEKLGPDNIIELTADYPLRSIGNLKVVLPKVLIVMRNARNFKEQAENLKHINFNTNDVMYASAHQDYSLITADMATSDFKSLEAKKIMEENRATDSDLRVTFDDLYDMHIFYHITPQLYKFIGTQDFSAPYQQYTEMMNYLFVDYKEISLMKIYSDTICCNKLAIIIVASTTNKRGYQSNIKEQISLLYNHFLENYSYVIREVLSRLLRLLRGARWLGLPDIIVVGKIFFKVSEVQREFLSATIIELKEELIQHLHVYDANQCALDAATYVSCLFQLNEEKSDEQLKKKLPRIFSLIDNRNFKLDQLKEFITQLKQFKRKYGKHAYNELIDILSILKLTDTAKPRPTMQDVLNAVGAIDKTSNLSVQQYIGRSLPPNCTYNPADCRSVMLKPLGVGEVLKAFELAARSVGKKVDSIELNGDNGLNYIVRIIEDEKDQIWKDLATQFVVKIQEEHRSKHIIRISLANESDRRILLAIVHTIFCPCQATNIADSIVPMMEYTQHVSHFIDALIEIQKKWPTDLSELLVQTCGDPTVKRHSIKFLNDFLCQVTQTFSKKQPFPSDFFAMLLEHEKTHGIKPELLAIDTIFGAKAVTRDHKMQILKMNLDSAAVNVNAVQFITQLIQFYDQYAPVFSCLLLIIENCQSERQAVFSATLTLLQLLVEINHEKLTKHLFSLFESNPTAYLGILQCIATVVPENVTKMETDTPQENAGQLQKNPLDTAESKQTARHIITRMVFQCCDSSEFFETEVNNMIRLLTYENAATLQALIEMRPAPTFKTLQIILKKNLCQSFLEDPSDPIYLYRFLDKQFDISRALSAIEEIKNLERGKTLFFSQRKKLLLQFLLVNRFGYHANSPIYLRDAESLKPKELTGKDLTEFEMRHLVARCRSVYKDPAASAVDVENAQLVFIALVREAIWRVTTNFPYSTQVLSVLISVMHKGSLLGEIDTGEGKAMIMAMVAANLWFEREAVNFSTSNLELAHVGFEEFSPVFDLLGIPRAGSVVTSQTSVTEYCYNGINYSDTAQLSLFIAKQKLDPYYIKYYQQAPLSLALDEADFTIFDDDTHYRYATTLHQTDLIFVFHALYQFIHSEKFKDEKATIENDINMARQLLLEEAKKLLKDSAYIARLSDRQIDTWLESALAAARQLKEGKHFVVRTESRGLGEEAYNVSFARILANSRVSEGAEWSNGVHQFLHTRLNEERVTKQRRIPPFPLDPETAPIASISSKNMIQHHMDRGRIFGVTGTAGSHDEIGELTEQAIKPFRIPPHRPNKRVTEPPLLACGEDNHFALIITAILRHMRQGNLLSLWYYELDKKPQPMLICFNDIDKSQRFYDFLILNMDTFGWYKNLLTTQLLNGSRKMFNAVDSTFSENTILSKAGVAGCITVSTMFERGSDFKPRLNESDIHQNHPKGLFVIQTFIAPERWSRQMAGRCARQSHDGQYQLIVDQKEFDELLDPSIRSVASIGILQQERAQTEKSKRRFAERLGSVKNFFFSKYVAFVQDEKNITPDINRKWAECLNNMDIEWHRVTALYRQKQKLTEREVLAKCTTDLIRKAAKDWNFLVPCDESLMLRPIEVEEIILRPRSVVSLTEHGEDTFKLTLDANEVSPAKHYIENSPLLMTLENKDQHHIADLKKRIESKRLTAAYECIGQIFDEEIDITQSEKCLNTAFVNLMEKVYSGHPIPYRKKLVEIFSIGQWSEDEGLQLELSRIFLKRLYEFAIAKLAAFGGLTSVIDRTKVTNQALSKEAVDIEALLHYLVETLEVKAIERKDELEKMNPVESVVDTAVTTVVAWFQWDTLASVLKRLIVLIDHPFTREQAKLTEVLKDAETSLLFADSWCMFFSNKAANDKKSKVETPELNSPCAERSVGYVLV